MDVILACVITMSRINTSFLFLLQTITTAMSTLTPPVTLEDPANQSRMDYVLEVSSSPDFDYPPVSQPLLVLFALHVAKRNWLHLRRSRITHRPSRAREKYRRSLRDNRLGRRVASRVLLSE